jgi:hypothetical protein
LKIFKKFLWILGIFAALCLLIVGFLWLYLPRADFGTPANGRAAILEAAAAQLDAEEGSDVHKAIIDIYNAHEPLAQGYLVKPEDNWCATYVSAMAITCKMTDIIPTECGCQRQIGLFDELGCWQEDDAYVPLPGDYIFYAIGNKDANNTAWSDHVGIVVGTWNEYMKVIEGNYNEAVSYRIIKVDDMKIRGYGLPDYASITE